MIPWFQWFPWASALVRLLRRAHLHFLLFLLQNRIQPVVLALNRNRHLNGWAWREGSGICWSPLCSQMFHSFFVLFLYLWRIRLNLVDLWIFSSLNLLDRRVALLSLRRPVLLDISSQVAASLLQFCLRISWSGAFWSRSWVLLDLPKVLFTLWIFRRQRTPFEFKISNIQRLAFYAETPLFAWHLQRQIILICVPVCRKYFPHIVGFALIDFQPQGQISSVVSAHIRWQLRHLLSSSSILMEPDFRKLVLAELGRARPIFSLTCSSRLLLSGIWTIIWRYHYIERHILHIICMIARHFRIWNWSSFHFKFLFCFLIEKLFKKRKKWNE